MLNWLPPNISTYGGDIDKFFHVIYYFTTTVFCFVAASMFISFLNIDKKKLKLTLCEVNSGNNETVKNPP